MSQSTAYKAMRAVCIVLGSIAAVIMAIVTVVAEKTGSESAAFMAMPGIICHLLITGGHGGTHAQEIAGFTVAICANVLLVALCFFLVFAILKRAQK